MNKIYIYVCMCVCICVRVCVCVCICVFVLAALRGASRMILALVIVFIHNVYTEFIICVIWWIGNELFSVLMF